jgi:hypothetical protein
MSARNAPGASATISQMLVALGGGNGSPKLGKHHYENAGS